PGRVELADGGTLFLDEVGDMPLELQPKLLRTIQEHTYERVGSARTKNVDVRLVAATNCDLEQLVEEKRRKRTARKKESICLWWLSEEKSGGMGRWKKKKRFRGALYYRLNVFP